VSIATVASMTEVLGLRCGPQDLAANQRVLLFQMGVSLLSGGAGRRAEHVFPASARLRPGQGSGD